MICYALCGIFPRDSPLSLLAPLQSSPPSSRGVPFNVKFAQPKGSRRQRFELDLYNRRFQIFTSILDFYQALVQWKGTPDQRTVQLNFLRAYQESGFLFANPEIQEILNGLYEHSGSVIGLMRNREAFETGGQDILLHQLNEKYPALVAEFDAALTQLKALMADDLNFHTIIKR